MNKALAELNALCLINAQDVIARLYEDSDEDISIRYGTEEDGLNVAMKYIELAERANRIFFLGNLPASIEISQPDKYGERVFKKYEFADMGKEAE